MPIIMFDTRGLTRKNAGKTISRLTFGLAFFTT